MTTLTRIPLSDANPATYNPREQLKPDDPRYKALAKSMDEFGLVQPLVWNCRTKTLVGGHQRLQVLRARGETHADVVVVDLPLEREKALNLALNKVSGGWDREKLAAVLDELTQTPEFDLGATGFEVPEVEQLLEAYREEPDAEASSEVDESAPAVTQPGDLIELGLGEHRLLCGDATSERDMARLLDGDRARMLHTDPPYGVSYDPRRRKRQKGVPAERSPRTGKLQNDDLGPKKYAAWLGRVVTPWKDALAKGSPIYVWQARGQFGLTSDLLVEHGFHISTVLTWAKETASLGFSDYSDQTEFCLYGWRKGAPHRWYGPKNATSLWQVPRERSDWYRHPTQKALELAERAIRNSSQPGDIVLDPFLGSGTTLIASARLGRRGFGLELEPAYCDVIVRRYIALAGENAVAPEVAERYREVAR